MDDATRVRFQAGALLILVFATGTVTGGALVYAGIRAARQPTIFRADPNQTVIATRGGLPASYADLNLTEDQRRAIERIIAESRPRTDSILGTALPALRAATDSMQARMRAVLTPAQQKRLDDDSGPLLVQPSFGPAIIRGRPPGPH
jgi:hypothetical protein